MKFRGEKKIHGLKYTWNVKYYNIYNTTFIIYKILLIFYVKILFSNSARSKSFYG